MKKIILVSNTAWYIYNFRKLLLEEIVKSGFKLVIVIPYSEVYTEKLKADGYEIINWDLNRISINPFSSFISIFNLLKIYIKEKPDIVNHFTIKPCVIGSLISLFLPIKKCVNTIAGIGAWYKNDQIYMRLLLFFINPILKLIFKRKSVQFIFHNIDDKKVFLSKGYTTNQNSTLIEGSGVDCNFFKPSENIKKNKNTINILFPARLIREKGIIELIEACEILWKENFNFNLLIAGELDSGNNSSLPIQELERIRINKKIKFLGHLEDMRIAYEKCDLVVLPSWREGLSRALIEASSMECPIITTNVPGCREIVDDQINGLLVSPKEIDELKNAIKRLILNKDIFKMFAKNARAKAIKKYDAKIVNKKIINLFMS